MSETKRRMPVYGVVLICVAALVHLAIIVAVVAMLPAGFHALLGPHPYQDYTDTNGPDDTSLALLTEEELLTEDSAYLAKHTSEGKSGTQTGLGLEWDDYDYQQVKSRSKFITGIKTLQATFVEQGTLVLEITSILRSGNAEIIILVDGEYYQHVPVNETVSVTLEDMDGKTVIVRMGCEAAEMEIIVERKIVE